MENNNSIYNLITSLCEKFTQNPQDVRKLRSIMYGILLNKRQPTVRKDFSDINAPDSFCKLLAWQFVLSHQFGLVEFGQKLRICGENLQKAYGNDNYTFNRNLEFLLGLKQVPTVKDDPLDINFDIPQNLQNLFKLTSKEEENPTSSTQLELINDARQLDVDENIWEIVTKEKFNERKIWENFGYPEPEKEPLFLSELGLNSQLFVENLPSVYYTCTLRDKHPFKPKIKQFEEFVQDLKYLLVGLASDSFHYDEKGDFFLVPNLTIIGIKPELLASFTKELIRCGNCFKGLNEISTPDTVTGKYRHDGYIFSEFCVSIRRYLDFYRTSVFNLPLKIGLIKFSGLTANLRKQIFVLTSICKVGPFTVCEDMPHGVALLNYLYQKILNLTDNSVIMVLYSILYPCCQVYYSRFLQQWILEGNISDPYDEFFIRPNLKFLSTRGRIYWTRSFTLKQATIPDFFFDLKIDILNCGKCVNLLKLCCPSSKLCLMGKKPPIFSCCVTADQLGVLQQNSTTYYLDVLCEMGEKFNLKEIIEKRKHTDPVFMDLIAAKRAITLKRIELERKNIEEEKREKKIDEINSLKEQYDLAIEQKELKAAVEMEKEIKIMRSGLANDLLREKLIQEESGKIISYYDELNKIVQTRKNKIDKHIEMLKVNIDQTQNQNERQIIINDPSDDDITSRTNLVEKLENNVEVGEKVEIEEQSGKTTMPTSESLDIINANAQEMSDITRNALENFEIARQNKQKVLTQELDLNVNKNLVKNVFLDNQNLSDAQKNKLKVLSSEFGISIIQPKLIIEKQLTQAEINRKQNMKSNACFYGKVDNDNYVNSNVDNLRKSQSLTLEIKRIEDTKPVPMSVDSTPLSDLGAGTPASKMPSSFIESGTTTANATDDGFSFSTEIKQTPILMPVKTGFDTVFSKRIKPEEVDGLSSNCLQLFLHESLLIPLTTQTKLIDNELLRYFINDLDYLQHLISLRNYFFMQDGEFSRNITENLFEQLYTVNSPVGLINCRSLQRLLFNALDVSSKYQQNTGLLSFKVNYLPKMFNLGDPDVLYCLSLSYKIKWPLNILLPVDAIGKYDEVFKYLLKVNRISWVLKKIFLEMKILAKETGKKEIYLMMSLHYRRLHQCRHVMLHFIQTLQNYIVGEVLQPSWEVFEKNLMNISNLDELYYAHVTYIKNITFLCLLNQKSTPLRKVIHKIFLIILKFYDYLRSRSWICENGVYIHPNFEKLEIIFNNFEEMVLYLFKIVSKVTKSGYQPHLRQLLDMLDINDYYSSKNHA